MAWAMAEYAPGPASADGGIEITGKQRRQVAVRGMGNSNRWACTEPEEKT